eukprot:TRINITY_DN16674_c0_g1_i1.p1 TRINITY_DN16674_c0_g1~~TRINITY_DN16674_c0_g1_i1.p1  ORF type:complete len:373 (+),score=77.19 TRINITY_DN16674_c0_g1_i1:45-1163(+)
MEERELVKIKPKWTTRVKQRAGRVYFIMTGDNGLVWEKTFTDFENLRAVIPETVQKALPKNHMFPAKTFFIPTSEEIELRSVVFTSLAQNLYENYLSEKEVKDFFVDNWVTTKTITFFGDFIEDEKTEISYEAADINTFFKAMTFFGAHEPKILNYLKTEFMDSEHVASGNCTLTSEISSSVASDVLDMMDKDLVRQKFLVSHIISRIKGIIRETWAQSKSFLRPSLKGEFVFNMCEDRISKEKKTPKGAKRFLSYYNIKVTYHNEHVKKNTWLFMTEDEIYTIHITYKFTAVDVEEEMLRTCRRQNSLSWTLDAGGAALHEETCTGSGEKIRTELVRLSASETSDLRKAVTPGCCFFSCAHTTSDATDLSY